MPINYTNKIESINPAQLKGFFVGWPSHPEPETHLEILRGSYATWLALDQNKCVGFINALSDSVFYAFIPLLEVLPDYQGNGIGTELANRMFETLKDMYAIDVVCDESIAPFYERLGLSRRIGMIQRNSDKKGPVNNRIELT